MKNLLFEKVTIKRRTLGVEDSNGNPTYTWSTVLTDEPCRTYYKYYTELYDGQRIVQKILKVALIYKGIQIDEGDIALLGSLNYEIAKAYVRYAGAIAHHWELEMGKIVGETEVE